MYRVSIAGYARNDHHVGRLRGSGWDELTSGIACRAHLLHFAPWANQLMRPASDP